MSDCIFCRKFNTPDEDSVYYIWYLQFFFYSKFKFSATTSSVCVMHGTTAPVTPEVWYKCCVCSTASQKPLLLTAAGKRGRVYLPYCVFHLNREPISVVWLRLKGKVVTVGQCVKLDTRKSCQSFRATYLRRSPQRNTALRFWPAKLTAQATDRNKLLWVSLIKGP